MKYRVVRLLALAATASTFAACQVRSGEDVDSATSSQTTYHATWTAKPTTGGPGPQQLLPTCVYDRERKAVLYFGGATPNGSNGPTVGDPAVTYWWNGSGWSQAAVAGAGPSPRIDHAMAYDSIRKVTVLFGGSRRSGYPLNDTWEFDGTSWREIPPPPTGAPPPRSSHAMAFDESRGYVVLQGGFGTTSGLGDTWAWDGTVWKQLDAGSSGTVRFHHLMAYHPGKQRVVMMGNGSQSGSGDAREWTGSAWTTMPEGNGGERFFGNLVYDTDRSALVRFRGWGDDRPGYEASFNEHVELRGGSWSAVVTTGPGPRQDYGYSPRACVAYDEGRRVLVVSRGDTVFPNENVYELSWIPQANQPPAFVPIGPQQVYAGDKLALTIRATDPDDPVVQIAASSLPAGATFDPSTGSFAFTPTPAQAGHHTIQFTADDGYGGTATMSIDVEVLFPTYAALPTGSISLQGDVAVTMTNTDFCADGWRHTGCGPWTTVSRFSCKVTGNNPGKVVVACGGDFEVPHIDYDPNTGGALRYSDISITIVGTANLDASSKFVFTDVTSPPGPGRPSEFRSLGGHLEMASPMDVKLVIDDAALGDVFGHGQSKNAGPGEVWLNPM